MDCVALLQFAFRNVIHNGLSCLVTAYFALQMTRQYNYHFYRVRALAVISATTKCI